MKKLVVASNNQHKIEEIKAILSKYSVDIISMKEAGLDIEVEENGVTFLDNAYIKASAIYKLLDKYMVLADDSGLMVDALGGAPGVYSARFAGEHGNSKKNNEKLLEMLKGKNREERSAKFVCAMVLIIDKDRIIKVQGEINGIITEEYIGDSGFGYDPLFYIPKHKMTFAEMGAENKNSISHRAVALRKLESEFQSLYFTRE